MGVGGLLFWELDPEAPTWVERGGAVSPSSSLRPNFPADTPHACSWFGGAEGWLPPLAVPHPHLFCSPKLTGTGEVLAPCAPRPSPGQTLLFIVWWREFQPPASPVRSGLDLPGATDQAE